MDVARNFTHASHDCYATNHQSTPWPANESMRRDRKPPTAVPHPGQFIRTRVIDPLGLSVKEAAQALGVHRVALSRLLNEQASLSPEMAIRIEKAFGARMEELMKLQSDYDIALAHLREKDIKVARFVPDAAVRKAQPRL